MQHYFFFENPNLSKLSREANKKCEEKITKEECQNIIKTFQLGKTPGNDGLPIEFYNVFWSSIGEMVVESFNEAYEVGEMSNSQRQGALHLSKKQVKTEPILRTGDQFCSLMLTLK